MPKSSELKNKRVKRLSGPQPSKWKKEITPPAHMTMGDIHKMRIESGYYVDMRDLTRMLYPNISQQWPTMQGHPQIGGTAHGANSSGVANEGGGGQWGNVHQTLVPSKVQQAPSNVQDNGPVADYSAYYAREGIAYGSPLQMQLNAPGTSGVQDDKMADGNTMKLESVYSSSDFFHTNKGFVQGNAMPNLPSYPMFPSAADMPSAQTVSNEENVPPNTTTGNNRSGRTMYDVLEPHAFDIIEHNLQMASASQASASAPWPNEENVPPNTTTGNNRSGRTMYDVLEPHAFDIIEHHLQMASASQASASAPWPNEEVNANYEMGHEMFPNVGSGGVPQWPPLPSFDHVFNSLSMQRSGAGKFPNFQAGHLPAANGPASDGRMMPPGFGGGFAPRFPWQGMGLGMEGMIPSFQDAFPAKMAGFASTMMPSAGAEEATSEDEAWLQVQGRESFVGTDLSSPNAGNSVTDL